MTIEVIGERSDTIVATSGNAIGTGKEIEFLRGNASATCLPLTGNERANTILGNTGNNTITGGAGVDVLNGAAAAAQSASQMRILLTGTGLGLAATDFLHA